jgi:hypothetical protein
MLQKRRTCQPALLGAQAFVFFVVLQWNNQGIQHMNSMK